MKASEMPFCHCSYCMNDIYDPQEIVVFWNETIFHSDCFVEKMVFREFRDSVEDCELLADAFGGECGRAEDYDENERFREKDPDAAYDMWREEHCQ